MKKVISVLLVLVLLLGALPLAGAEFSNTAMVIDTADVINESTERDIWAYNSLLKKYCGSEIAVAVVNTTGNQYIDTYAYNLYCTMEVGSAKTDNGVLILLAIDNDDYYVYMGTGAEAIIGADNLSVLLNKYLEPDFAKQKYQNGVWKLYKALFDIIYDYYEAAAWQKSAASSNGIPKRTNDFYYFDGCGVLTNKTRAEIYFNNLNLYAACGCQIVVAVVDNTRGYTTQEYATKIFNSWKISENGMLVLLSIEDADYYVTLGTGASAVSTTKLSKLLNQYLEPYFAQGYYDQGAEYIFYALFDAANSYYRTKLNYIEF